MGDRFKVIAHIGSPKQARTVALQWQGKDIFGNSVWTAQGSHSVAGHTTRHFTVTATQPNRQRFRVVVTYRTGRVVRSRAVSTLEYDWISINNFPAYYSAGGAENSPYGAFAMNGDTWKGWYDYDGAMAETRHTTGRNCKAFRGTMGLTDRSADGSTGQITLLTEESHVVYTSPTLVPGQVTKVLLPLSKPYRFSVQARNTSPAGLAAYPAIGDAAFLCATR